MKAIISGKYEAGNTMISFVKNAEQLKEVYHYPLGFVDMNKTINSGNIKYNELYIRERLIIKRYKVLKKTFPWATDEQLREIDIFSQGVSMGTLIKLNKEEEG